MLALGELLLAVLVLQLGANDFAARERASAALRALGEPVVPALWRATNHDDPEVRRRAVMLLDDWRNTFRPSCGSPTPWLDMLPQDYPERQTVIQTYLDIVRNAGLPVAGGADWPKYRVATELWIDAQMVAKARRADVVRILDQMMVREQEYRRRQGGGVAVGQR